MLSSSSLPLRKGFSSSLLLPSLTTSISTLSSSSSSSLSSSSSPFSSSISLPLPLLSFSSLPLSSSPTRLFSGGAPVTANYPYPKLNPQSTTHMYPIVGSHVPDDPNDYIPPTSNAVTSQQYIEEIAVLEVDGTVAICDGGGGLMGHPMEYIQLARVKEMRPATCKYCGLRFINRKVAEKGRKEQKLKEEAEAARASEGGKSH